MNRVVRWWRSKNLYITFTNHELVTMIMKVMMSSWTVMSNEDPMSITKSEDHFVKVAISWVLVRRYLLVRVFDGLEFSLFIKVRSLCCSFYFPCLNTGAPTGKPLSSKSCCGKVFKYSNALRIGSGTGGGVGRWAP